MNPVVKFLVDRGDTVPMTFLAISQYRRPIFSVIDYEFDEHGTNCPICLGSASTPKAWSMNRRDYRNGFYWDDENESVPYSEDLLDDLVYRARMKASRLEIAATEKLLPERKT